MEGFPRSSSVELVSEPVKKLLKRPLIRPSPAIQSLVQKVQLSHYNYLANSYRSPTKYDHFHSKTYISSFIPSFRASRFAHSEFVWEYSDRPKEKWELIRPKPERKAPRRLPPIRTDRVPRYKSSSQDLPPSPPLSPCEPPTRRILCLRDGQSLKAPHFPYFSLDFDSFLHRYFAFDRHGYYLPSRNTSVNLETQAKLDILEQAAEALKSQKGFQCMFFSDGSAVTDLMKVPKDCEVMLFSETGVFQGLQS